MGETKIVEMMYHTWGSHGQHEAIHYIFCVSDMCYDEVNAYRQKIIELVENKDHHSNKNYHYHRVYKYDISKVDAVISIKCHASSSKHRSDIKVIHGNAEVKQMFDDVGELAQYMVVVGSKKYLIPKCVAGFRVKVVDYDDYLRKEQEKLERERQKKEKPRIIITYNADRKRIKLDGDTYYHKETLKKIFIDMGMRLKWDFIDKYWYAEDVKEQEVNDVIEAIKNVIPNAEIIRR